MKKEIKWTKIGDLEWSKDLGSMNWNDAVKWCKEQGGRLPKRWEMIKAVDEHFDEIQDLIKSSPSYFFWSGTEYSATNAWYVSLSYGNTVNAYKSTYSNQVRCVR